VTREEIYSFKGGGRGLPLKDRGKKKKGRRKRNFTTFTDVSATMKIKGKKDGRSPTSWRKRGSSLLQSFSKERGGSPIGRVSKKKENFYSIGCDTRRGKKRIL